MSWVAAAIGGSAIVGGAAGLYGGKKAASATKNAAGQSADVQRYMFDQSQQMQAPWQQTGASALAQLAGLYGLSPVNYMGDPAAQGAMAQAAVPQAAVQTKRKSGGLLGKVSGGLLGSVGGGLLGGGGGPGLVGLASRLGGSRVNEIPGANQQLSLTPGQPSAPIDGAPTGFAGSVPTRDAAMANFQTSPGYQFRMDESMKALGGMRSAMGQRGHGATAADIMRYSQGLASDEYNQYTNRLAALAGIGQTSAGAMGANAMATGQNIGQSYMNAGNARASGILGATNTLGNTMNNAAWMYGMYGGGGGIEPGFSQSGSRTRGGSVYGGG